MSSIRSILEEAVNRVEWCVNPEQLAAVTINREKETVIIDQALLEISQIIDEARPKLMSDTSLIYKKWSVEMILNEYQSNLKELLK